MPSPGVTTLTTVTTQSQQRADMVNSGFISASEWTSMINASYQELYGLILQTYGPSHYYFNTSIITTDGVNETFSLPSDFFKLVGVDLQYVSGQPQSYVTLRPFTMAERNRWSFPTYLTVFGWTNLHYALQGSNLWLKPLPQSGQSIKLYYYPRLTLLVSGSDTLDGVNGWEEYIVTDVAIKALQKEESDVSVLMAQKAAIIQRLEAEAENRDAGSGAKVSDVQWSNASYDGVMGGSGGSWW